MKTNRYSCKCKLCKAKWTTEKTDRVAAYTAHGQTCERYLKIWAIWRERYPNRPEDSDRYQLSCQYFEHIPIKGHYNPAVKCDGRCMSATGHNCECQCGGANHGIGAAA